MLVEDAGNSIGALMNASNTNYIARKFQRRSGGYTTLPTSSTVLKKRLKLILPKL
jgi:hypothetical protein